MEKVLEHEIERELLTAPPRRVRMTASTALLLATAALLFMVFVYGGGKALAESARAAWLALFGHRSSATITRLVYSANPPTAGDARQSVIGVTYTFRDQAGKLRSGFAPTVPMSSPDPPEEYAKTGAIHVGSPPKGAKNNRGLLPGAVFVVRYATWHGRLVSGPANSPSVSSVLFLAFAGFLVLVVSSLLFVRMVRGTWFQWRLIRHGHATTGTIIHKSSQTEESLRYALRYGYSDKAGNLYEQEEACTVEQYRCFDIGQPVTVLYSNKDPREAALYALIPFKCSPKAAEL